MADLNRIKIVLAEMKKTGKWLVAELGKNTCAVSKWCCNTAQLDSTPSMMSQTFLGWTEEKCLYLIARNYECHRSL